MKEQLIKAILNLLKIKSLFSLMAIYVIIYGIHTDKIDIAVIISIVSMIISFYFNKDKEDKGGLQ